MSRILLKLSGEALAGERGTGFDAAVCDRVAGEVAGLIKAGTQVALVIGGGNFWRGAGKEMERVRADQIGMLATVMNALYMSEAVARAGVKSRVFVPFAVEGVAEVFRKDLALSALEAGEAVFFAGGTGHPYFSTDTATVLRAIEIEADEILLAKSIDGVYDADPEVVPDAKRYDTISLSEVIEKRLGVIDLTASMLCLENRMPLSVFALAEEGSIAAAASGSFRGTRVTAE